MKKWAHAYLKSSILLLQIEKWIHKYISKAADKWKNMVVIYINKMQDMKDMGLFFTLKIVFNSVNNYCCKVHQQ